ncbi:MAG: GWxTD domain-containing protein [Candidatus Latescibacterota bacterium]|nr:MAG: GWxTD domain-containing protein [Candidatus Latescibacterota bacterium]
MRRAVCAALLSFFGVMAASMVRGEVPEHVRLAIEEHEKRSGPSRTLEEHLHELVEADAGFDRRGGEKERLEPLGRHMQAVYYGLRPLLGNDLRAQFVGLSSDSLRGEWLRRYWLLRDPTPTTRENERREEHERRVRFARRHFVHVSPPFWDDRGRFYVLFGPPDGMNRVPADVRASRGYIPARLYWFYGDPGLLVTFERPNPEGPWQLGVSAQKFSSRPDLRREAFQGMGDFFLGYGLRPTHYDADRTRPFEIDPYQAANVALSTAAASEIVEKRRERFVPPGGSKPSLWFVSDSDAFRGEAGMARLEAHVQLDLEKLRFAWEDSLYAARFRFEAVLFDAALHEVGRASYQERLTAERFDSTTHARLWPGQLDFDVPAGRYRVVLRVADPATGAEGVYEGVVTVPNLHERDLALSDLELATRIVPARSSTYSRFAKGERLVLPNPIGLYERSGQLTAYFEIYGLDLDAGTSRYRISYQIVAAEGGDWRNPERTLRPFATSTFISQGASADPAEELRVDIAALDEGTYALVVTVQDLVGEGSASTATAFSVVRY